MTFKQLLKTNTWSAILPVFLKIYPKGKKNVMGYETVFEKLVMMPSEETDISIIITKEKDDDEEYIDVSGFYNNQKKEENKYSQGIELTPWRKWLGMDISKDSLKDFSELEIIVHCLYEMTFVGFSEEDIQKRMSKIEKSRKERKSMTKEVRDAITVSVEDLLNEWCDEVNN